MKYCVPYFKAFKYMEEIDEIIIPYDEKDINFIQSILKQENLKDKVLIIDVQDMAAFYENNTMSIFLELQKQGYKIKLKFNEYDDESDLYQKLKENNLSFFFGLYVRHWDVFTHLIKMGVSDVYIIEELAFELNLLGPVAHASNVSIRVFANIAQSSWDENHSIKSFFIRPEDISIYEPYVDVIEFFGKTKEVQEVMIKVYAIKKKWIGDLNELIIGLAESVPNKSIIPAIFGAIRVKCGKKCLKGSKCNICNSLVQTANTLNEKDLIFN